MHTAIQKLDQSAKSKLVGGVLFGDTLNQRNRHQIPGFPADRIVEYCASGDGICELAFKGITSAHLAYGTNGMDRQAVDFLVNKIKSHGAGPGGGEVTGKAGSGSRAGKGGMAMSMGN